MQWRLSLPSIFSRRDWRDDLSAYLDDELAPRQRTRIEAQLAQSDEMRQYLADLQDMRSVLRGFAPARSAAPFQLTPEVIERGTRVPLVESGATRALRMSMATAAVGVAAFAAVMVFDVIDSPTVTFTTTQAGDTSNSVPTAQVVTEEVEMQPESAAQSDSATVADVSSGSEQPGRVDPPAVEAEQAEAEQEAAVAVVEIEEQEVVQQQEAEYAAQQEEAEQEQWQAEQAEQAEQAQSAAADPSRRALTAGGNASEGDEHDAQRVTADDVVAQQKAEATEDDAERSQPTEAEATGSSSVDEEAAQPEAAGPAEREPVDDVPGTDAETEVQRRTVASSVRHTESDWPLEERPRSRSVELATDPSWERPVQIVLAAFAVAATTFWLTLAVVDRRRRT